MSGVVWTNLMLAVGMVGCATTPPTEGPKPIQPAGQLHQLDTRRGSFPERAIEVAEIQLLQRKHAEAIRRCEARYRSSDSRASDVSVDVSLVLAPGGEVVEVEIRGGALAALKSCIAAVLRRWRFDPLGGSGATVTFPLLFRARPLIPRSGRPIVLAEIEALQREHGAALLGCLAQAVDRAVAKGDVDVWFTLLVLPSGEVERAEAAGGWDAAFDRCVAQQVGRWRFAPLGGNAPAQTRFPIQFRGLPAKN